MDLLADGKASDVDGKRKDGRSPQQRRLIAKHGGSVSPSKLAICRDSLSAVISRSLPLLAAARAFSCARERGCVPFGEEARSTGEGKQARPRLYRYRRFDSRRSF